MGWELRSLIAEEYGTPIYVKGSSFFTIVMHHGGQLTNYPTKMYVGDNIGKNYFDYCDVDEMSMLELNAMGKELGYYGFVRFFHKMAQKYVGDDIIYRPLENDKDVTFFYQFMPSNREIEIYLDCKTLFELHRSQTGSSGGGEGSSQRNGGVQGNKQTIGVGEGSSQTIGGGTKGNYQIAVGIEQEDDDIESSEYDSLNDSEYEYDDELFEAHIDKDVEYCGVEAKDKDMVYKTEIVEDDEIECDSSDGLQSPIGSDDDEGQAKFPEFNSNTDMANPVFQLGMLFSDHKVFKEAVKSYSIKNGRLIRFTKNESTRVRAKCQEDCPWSIFASRMQGSTTMQVKAYTNEHKCNRQFKNIHANSRWLSEKYVDTFRSNPKMPVSCFKETVMREHVVSVSRSQVYRTRKKAMKMIEGTYKQQYAKLWDYIEEMKRTNPGSTIIMKLLDGSLEEGQPQFERIYICLQALKQGFKAGCRPFIGVDGCHLKGPQGGQLLAAVGVDANNSMYPLAYAVVEGETKKSWTWFLEILSEDLGVGEQWTFISDKQKGLLPAFEFVMPFVHHRYCVMHLYSNFKAAGFKGKVLKELLWNAANATNMPHFEQAMSQLREADEEAYNWLADKPALYWSKSHFSSFPKCEMLLNNICENFNKCILEAREKPILGLLERIRNYLMVRLQSNRLKINNWHGNICPKIQEMIEKNKVQSASCIPTWSGAACFQISCMHGDQFTCDLEAKTCSCGKWELSGIPCNHAISAIFFKGEDPESYVDQCYLIETNKKIYEPIIKPMNGIKMWPRSGKVAVLSPTYTRQPGRPKNKRTKQVDEVQQGNKLSRKHQVSLKCSVCGEIGHNKRSCKKRRDSGATVEATSGATIEGGKAAATHKATTAATQKATTAATFATRRGNNEGRKAAATHKATTAATQKATAAATFSTRRGNNEGRIAAAIVTGQRRSKLQVTKNPNSLSQFMPTPGLTQAPALTQNLPSITGRVNIRAPPQFISPPQWSQTPIAASSMRGSPVLVKGGKKYVTLSTLQSATSKKK